LICFSRRYAPVDASMSFLTMYRFARETSTKAKFVFFDIPLYLTFEKPKIFFSMREIYFRFCPLIRGGELGMKRGQSVWYRAEMFQSLSFLLKEEEMADFGTLLEKYTTKGGLSELALETILNEDGYAPWKKVLVAI